MNVLDRAINFVAPRYRLPRTQARMALELTEGYLDRHPSRFSYDGASAGRRACGWYAPSIVNVDGHPRVRPSHCGVEEFGRSRCTLSLPPFTLSKQHH
jgi:hypothetical protein